jgi:hypothetical protein
MSVKVLVRAWMLVTGVAAVLVWLPTSVRAHDACGDYDCCSPHGATRSDSGCGFYNCAHPGPDTYWQRWFLCDPGSQAAMSNCWSGIYMNGQSSADSSHAVTTFWWECCNAQEGGCI